MVTMERFNMILFPSAAAVSRFAFFAAALIIAVCTATPVVTDPWRVPCYSGTGGNTPTNNVDLVEVMSSLKTYAGDLESSAKNHKNFLTGGQNPRVPATVADSLDNFNAHVTNFPYDFQSDPKENVTEVLITDYIYLSKLYIFFAQSKLNANACDQRVDKADALRKFQSLLDKTLLTLCDVDTYLRASGHPMPPEKVPSKTEVLDASVPKMADIPLMCETNDSSRNEVDYVNARDTVKTSIQLKLQYIVLHDRLSSQSNASG